MSESDFSFRDKTIAVVGLGLMGGSLALALRDKNAARRIIAIDTDPGTRAQAEKSGLAAYASLDAIAEANVIVLATPVRTIIELVPRVGEIARQGTILIDLGSVMRDIVRVMDQLPPHLQPISGHPMCGKETSGFPAADAELYHNAVFALTPLARTTPETVAAAFALATGLGARPVVLDAERHDRIVAAISHLPYAVASALMMVADELARDDGMFFILAAGGFRDTSRLAASDAKMMLDILLTNSENVTSAMRAFSKRFEELTGLIERRDEPRLRAILRSTAEKRREVIGPRMDEGNS